MTPRSGRFGRIRQLWEILLRDPTALSEVLSGCFLVALRGLLIVGAPKLIAEGSRLSDLMHPLGITDDTWGSYLMVWGLLQVWLAGDRVPFWRATARVVVALMIVLGFGAMVSGFYVAYSAQHIPPSVVCMTAFEIFLLGRVGEEWWESWSWKIRRALRGGP